MAIILDVPEDTERYLREELNGELARIVLEAAVLDWHRRALISRGKVSELLNLSFEETMLLMKERDAYPTFTIQDFNKELVASQRIFKK